MDNLQDRASSSMNDSGTCVTIDTPVTQDRSGGVQGWTYFISDGDLIKIGFSIRPRRRVNQVAREIGKPVKTLAVVPISVAGEYETHQRFAHLREKGEWFRPEADLLAFIQGLRPVEAVAASKISKPKELRDPFIGRLHALRDRHRGNEPVRHRIGNISEIVLNLKNAKDPHQIAHLKKFLKWQSDDLSRLLAA